jgi:hypothetical protein
MASLERSPSMRTYVKSLSKNTVLPCHIERGEGLFQTHHENKCRKRSPALDLYSGPFPVEDQLPPSSAVHRLPFSRHSSGAHPDPRRLLASESYYYDEGEPSRGGPNLVLVVLVTVFGRCLSPEEEWRAATASAFFRPAPLLKKAK